MVLANSDRIREIAADCNTPAIALIGSVARGEDDDDSDCDFLADYSDDTSFFDVACMSARLEDLLGCPVDIVSRRVLPAHMAHVAAEAVAL